MLIRN
jgi:hypothetical protein